MDWSATRISHNLNWDAQGRQFADLRLKPSDNSRSLGYHAIPIAVLATGSGPTLLLTGGTHGDEFEGPAALLRIIHELDTSCLTGRLIVLPALNAPAVLVSERCSPLDGVNLNRAFPGNPNGTPTAQIAHMIESVILPHCDAAIDIHSGGKASRFTPLTMFNPSDDKAHERLGTANQELALTFGAPTIWRMGRLNDDRSVNGAAWRCRVPMFATELGGGGNIDPALADLAYDGIIRVMQSLNMWSGDVTPTTTTPVLVHVNSPDTTLYAQRSGLFVPRIDVGASVCAGDEVGTLYSIDEIERSPKQVTVNIDGKVLALTHNGSVKRGDFLVQVGIPTQ